MCKQQALLVLRYCIRNTTVYTALSIGIATEAPKFEKTLDLQKATDLIFNITDTYSHYWAQISFQNPQQFIIFKELTLLSETKIKGSKNYSNFWLIPVYFPLDILCLKKLSFFVSSGPLAPYKRTKANFTDLVETGMWNMLTRLLSYTANKFKSLKLYFRTSSALSEGREADLCS